MCFYSSSLTPSLRLLISYEVAEGSCHTQRERERWQRCASGIESATGMLCLLKAFRRCIITSFGIKVMVSDSILFLRHYAQQKASFPSILAAACIQSPEPPTKLDFFSTCRRLASARFLLWNPLSCRVAAEPRMKVTLRREKLRLPYCEPSNA